MSLIDRPRRVQLPELPDGNGISRSRSFAGFLNRSVSRKESMNPQTNPAGHDYRVLVQRASDHRLKNSKVPKTPQPARTLMLIDSLRVGLRECITLTNEDMQGLAYGNERMSIANTQQFKAADRYLKRLELQLSKLEELGENYNVQHKIREGVRNMAQAYMTSTGKERENALGKVKAGYKECTQNMCALEAQLEQMMGSLEMRMRGIAGFARLCPGDIFEIVIRHGMQKWKSRGHVNKDASQTWDNEGIMFKSLLGDILHVKASEVRTLGNRIIVGNKHCETKALFSAHPQVMTISLNTNGSLKLNLVVTWNPLDGTSDDNMWSPWMLRATNEPSKLKMSAVKVNSVDRTETLNSVQPTFREEVIHRHSVCSTMSIGSDRRSSASPKNPSSAGSMSPSVLSVTVSQNSLENVIRSVVTSMDDLHEQYPQLQKLRDQIFRIEKLLLPLEQNGRLSRGSDLSISVESALDCFDFLNEVEDEDISTSDRHVSRKHQQTILEEDQNEQKSKTVDSGIESVGERGGVKASDYANSDTKQLSSGNDQVDLTLIQHLLYCDTLLELLGSYGPLKHGESRALRHLQTQSDILEVLVKLIEDPALLDDFTSLMRDLTEKQRLHLLWEQCAGGHYLNTSADSVVTQLNARYVHFLKSLSESERQDVLELLICQMLDRPAYDPSAIVTLFHFLTFLRSDSHWDVEALLLKFHKNLKVLGSLQSKVAEEVVETLQSLRGNPVDAAYAVQIAVCLLSDNDSVQNAARDFLVASGKESSLRSWLIRTYATALEDDRVDIRRSACIALRHLEAVECLHELAHMVEFDVAPTVKIMARETLLAFGDEGQAVLRECEHSGDRFEAFSMKV